MDGRNIEPRNVMWAVAEITWEDDGGTSIRVPAILEEDGGDFLLGVRREAELSGLRSQPATGHLPTPKQEALRKIPPKPTPRTRPSRKPRFRRRFVCPNPGTQSQDRNSPTSCIRDRDGHSPVLLRPLPCIRRQKFTIRARPLVQPKMIFPHFWRPKQDQDAPAKSSMTEAPVNKPNTQEPTPSGPARRVAHL